MSDRIHVGTRKGLLTFDRTSTGWRESAADFLASPVTMLLHDSRDEALYAALRHGHYGTKLHRRDAKSGAWHEIASPTFPLDPKGSGPSVDQIWSLEAGGTEQEGLLWAGTLPGGLFRSEDCGDSWQLVESLWNETKDSDWFGGGYDDPGIHSIAVDPRNPDEITVGISCGGVWHTTDGGASWKTRTQGMWAAYMPPEQREQADIQDPHRIVRCPGQPDVLWSQHHNGVFVSRDAGRNWQECASVIPSTFGFAVAVHPEDGDIAWLAPAISDQERIPVDRRLVVSRTRDGGKSFEILGRGLPHEGAFDLIFRHCLDVDSSGKRLVLGSTTGGLWVSEDAGNSWQSVHQNLAPIYCLRFAL